jgi:5-methylcytosine-specific restriction endonuclease McrA
MDHPQSLTSFSDDELLHRLSDLLRRSRRDEADLVAHIGEVDSRRLYAREAQPSMFSYCTAVLHLSDAEAYLRIAAARAARVYPVILSHLAEGRMHLTAVAKIAPHLTGANCDALLGRAVHRSKRQIEELVAEISPRPDVPPSIRRLPAERDEATQPGRGRALDQARRGPRASAPDRSAVGASRHELRPEGVATPESEPGPETVAPAAPAIELRPGTVTATGIELRPDGVATSETLSGEATTRSGLPRARFEALEPFAPGRYRVQFTASAELRDKIERLRALTSASVPDGSLAALIDLAITEKLQRLESRRFARTAAPRKALSETRVTPRTRQVPAAVKRAVYERDGGQCGYKDKQGRRCPARQGLEFHHRHPFGFGGDHSVANVSLACSSHNRFMAEIDYGQEAIARRRGAHAAMRRPSSSP